MIIRLCKIALTAVSVFFLALVVLNNVTDYGSNFGFVQHVLDMSTTFPGNAAMWRAITAPWMHHAFYTTIILWEAAACGLLAAGTLRLWRARTAPAAEWRRAKSFAAAGFALSLVQWYAAFICVGGEWFLMWQSKTWNGQEAAFRMFAMMALCLLFLLQREDEPETA
jgi:predicted small integral membrane protein